MHSRATARAGRGRRLRPRSGCAPDSCRAKCIRSRGPLRQADPQPGFQNSQKQFVGIDRLAAHLLDLMDGDLATIELGIEQAQAVGRVLHLLQWHGARQHQDFFGDLRGRDPDLLAVDDIFVAGAHRAALQLCGIEPVLGSVTTKQDFSVPSAIPGSMRLHCSLVPNTTTGLSPNTFIWVAEAPDMPTPDSAIVRIMIAASTKPRPEPPYTSGMQMPSQPASASALWKSAGKPPSLSFFSQ